jgi:hypothetical protein
VCGGVGGVGGVGVKRTVPAHSLRSTFPRLHLLRLWTPTILYISEYSWQNKLQNAAQKDSNFLNIFQIGYNTSWLQTVQCRAHIRCLHSKRSALLEN